MKSKDYVKGGKLTEAQIARIHRLTVRRNAARELSERLNDQINELTFCPHGCNVTSGVCRNCDQMTGSRTWSQFMAEPKS